MKKILMGAAAVLAVAAPGVAHADTTGFVGLGYTALDDDDDGDKEDLVILDGAVASNIGGAWNVQFDAHHGYFDHGSHDDAFTNASAHLFARSSGWAAGGFAGLGTRGSDNIWLAGLEGQLYFSNVTLGGAWTFSDMTNGSGDTEFTLLDLDAAFFLTPNTSIGGGAGWYDDEWEGEDGYYVALNAEHQFAGSPFSIGGGYFMYDSDYSGGGGHEIDGFSIFGRMNFGTADLQTRSREGASLPGGVNFVRHASSVW